MKSSLILFACVVGSCLGQQASVDKAFFGVWNLDLAKSRFGPGGTPKGGQVFVNENGYIATYQDAPGAPPAVAVAIIHGECYLVGHVGLSCSVNMDTPRHPSINVKMGDTPMLKIDVALQGETAMTVKQTALGSPTGPVVTEFVYTKATQPPAPKKK